MFQTLALIVFLFQFSAFAQDAHKPDVVVVTEKLGSLPNDIVTKSFLSKVLSKEKIFKYQDEPDYFQVQGFLKRIAFEHNVTITDNIIKYLLEIPAEIALWKGDDGKLKHFSLSTRAGKIKETIAKLILTIADIASDTQVSKVDDGGQKAFLLRISNKEITVSMRDGVIGVTTLGNAYLPWNVQASGVDWKNGLYSGLYKTELGKNKHKMILSGEYITLGYSYFFPELQAMSFTFDNSHWTVSSLTSASEGKFVTETANLWKGIPFSPAMCLMVPVDGSRVAKLLDEKPAKNNFAAADLADMMNSPVGVCWYEDSSLFTPLFAMKVGKVDNLKEKLKVAFERYIGDPPLEDENTKKIESSMKVNDRNGNFDLTKEVDYYGTAWTVKLALKDDYLFFSPDQKLVNQAVATAAGKGTPVADELKDNKEISVLFSPFKVSGLLEDYLHSALPSGRESVFRASLESYFISSFKNLSTVKPFMLSMPKSFEAEAKWETLGMNDIP